MKIGDAAKTERRFTRHDVDDWVALTNENGPGGAAVPRPLVASLFSYLLGVHLPGPGTNYLKQDITWLAPAALDTPLTASVTITRLRPEKNLVDLETRCTDVDGQEICSGRALVYVADVIS